jgi:methyl-accepting chemotaxis protein
VPHSGTLPHPPERPATGAEHGTRLASLFAAAGIVALLTGLALSTLISPFPWRQAALVFVAGLGSRRFGASLPGKWFVSLTPAVAAAGIAALGWPAGGIIAGASIMIGDLLFRRSSVRRSLETAGHLAVGVVLGGAVYDLAGGIHGLGAFWDRNLLRLCLLFLAVPVIANASVFAQMRAQGIVGRINTGLTLRWETVAAGLGLALGATGLRITYGGFSGNIVVTVVVLWLGFAALASWVLQRGATAEGLLAAGELTRALGARTSFAAAFDDMRKLTGALLPWQDMGMARYDATTNEFVIVAETSATVRAGTRVSADTGLARLAVERREPVTDHDLSAGERAPHGAEILVPLTYGDRLVGLWSVRHGEHGTYSDSDARLLGHLATPLALAIALDGLVGPVLEASSQTTAQVGRIGGAAESLQAGADQAAANARRMAETVRSLAGTLGEGATRAEDTRAAAIASATHGESTRDGGQRMLNSARAMRSETAAATERLREAAAAVEAGTELLDRLREVSDKVERFRLTIRELADESGLLALNAAIEAARAGDAGRGFSVVAREVGELATGSTREAAQAARSVSEIRSTIEEAQQAMARVRREVLGVAGSGAALLERIDAILRSAEEVAALGETIAATARETEQRSTDLTGRLNAARSEANQAASESDRVAAGSAEQGQAVARLTRAAGELQQLANRLGAAHTPVGGGGAEY